MKLYKLDGGEVFEVLHIEKEVAVRLFSGVGLFETIKIIMGKPVFIREHLERLSSSAKNIWGIELPKSTIEAGAYRVCSVHEKAMLRIFLVVGERSIPQDSHIFFLVDKFPYDFTDGLKIKILDFQRNPHGFSAGLKPISYFENVVLREKMKKEGFDEGIFLYDGLIAEGTRTNIFWVKDGKVFTPPIRFGILNGITRQKVINICNSNGIECLEASLRPNEIFEQDEVFLTSSLLGVASVNTVNFRGVEREFHKNGVTHIIKRELELLEFMSILD